MPIYFDILLSVALVFVVIDVSPKTIAGTYWPLVPALQVQLFRNNIPAASAVRSFLAQQKQDSGAEHPTTSVALAQPASTPIAEPPFLRRPILFDPNSLELKVAGKNALKRAATWLRGHVDGRVLIVGSCDTSGSESCTHALAERRGDVIRRFLENLGVRSDQVVGVKAWDNDERSCRPVEIKCQQLGRSAQIFVAASATEEKP